MREAPHNLEAEQSVLGSVLLDNEAIEATGELPPEAFYSERNRVLYGAILELYNAGHAVDMVTLTEHLRTSGTLGKVGGLPYLLGLTEGTATAAYTHQYAGIVREKYRARQIIAAFGKAMQQAYDGTKVDKILEEHEAALTTFARFDTLERGPQDYAEGALEIIRGVGGLATGFRDLDYVTGGLVKGGFNVIAGRPSMGKSSFMRSILNKRVSEGDKVCLFSIDQGGDDIYAIEAAQRARVSLEDFRPDRHGNRRVSPRKQQEAEQHIMWLRDEWSQRFVIHDSRAELGSIITKARQEIRAGATVIALDHIQSVMLDGRTDETRVVSAISRAFKALSREYNVTVLILSQLNRSVDERPDPRPVLSDLRQSGAIEEDANQVMFVFREAYYNRDDPTKTGVAEIIIPKNKLGRTPQTVELTWLGRQVAFADKARDWQQTPIPYKDQN